MHRFNPRNKTVKELKDFARKNKIRGFSRLKKCDLICLIEKAQKKKKQKKKPVRKTPKKQLLNSKKVLSELKKKLETKKFKLILSNNDFTSNVWHLTTKDKIFMIALKQDLHKIDFVKRLGQFKRENPKWVELTGGITATTNFLIFGTKRTGDVYDKKIVDKMLRYFKNPIFYHKKGSHLKIEGKVFVGIIASRLSRKELNISIKLQDIFIPYSKYIELNKISMNKMKEQLVIKKNNRKDNVIRQFYIEQLALGKKELNIKKIAQILDWELEVAGRGFVNKGYVNTARNSMLFLKDWIRPEGRKTFRNLIPLKIDLQKIKSSEDRFIDLGNKEYEYTKKQIILPFKIFKNPRMFLNKIGLLIAIKGDIYLVSAPSIEK